MKVTIVVNVTTPIVNTAENMSIVKSAILFGNELTKAEVTKVCVCGFPQVEGNGSLANDPGTMMLFHWRPGDLISKPDLAKRADHIFMLFHEQDKHITDMQKLASILKGKKVYMFNSEFAEWVKNSTELPIITSIEHPIEPIPDRFDMNTAINRIAQAPDPIVTLWTSPSVRKNSLEGFFGCLDAIAIFKQPVVLNVVSNITGGNLRDSAELFTVPRNADLREYPNPPYGTLYDIISGSHVIVIPSVDEGYHLPVYEASRFGCSMVVADIPANRQAKRRNPNVKLAPMIADGLICGHPHEEISSAVPLGNLEYVSFVETILTELESYRGIATRMGEYMRKGHPTRQIWNLSENALQSHFGLGLRRNQGRAPITFL